VITAAERDSALAVARKMRDAHVGCVVLVRGGRPIGIVTDRDLTLRVMAEGRDPASTPISEVVTYDPVIVGLDDGLETAAAHMRLHGIRRLPIVDGSGAVVGMVTSDDLMVLFGRELADLCEGIDESADANDSR
jgi:CBS domain-containing protein